MRVRPIPSDDSYCGWTATLPPLAPARRLSGQQRADWVVVGAGVTGLAAARRLCLHQPESRIVLLEAQRVGAGASGRNSGFLVDVGHYQQRLGTEDNAHLVRLARAGIVQLRELVREHGIDCAWSERGRLHGAVEDIGRRGLDVLCRGLSRIEEPYETLDVAAVTAITGTEYYRAAVRTPGAVMVQPAALVRGLGACLPRQVELFEESPILSLGRSGDWRLETATGSVRTKHILLAANGFSAGLGFLRRRVFPMQTFASLTRPLRSDEQGALGGEPEWGLVPEERLGTTVRRTRDHRILIRNTLRYGTGARTGDGEIRRIREVHRRSFRARFPMLSEVDFEHTWGGVLGISLNDAQFFGRLAPGAFASAAYNGVGMALGTASGSLLADLAVGADSALLRDMQKLPRPAWIPPDPLLGVGVRWKIARMQKRAGAEL